MTLLCTVSRSHHPLIELVSRPLQKTLVLNQQPLNVNCPDGETECPDGYTRTCCAGEKKGTYACCPKTKGVCCPDHKHCCPEGYKCNTGDGQCLKVLPVVLTSTPARKECAGVLNIRSPSSIPYSRKLVIESELEFCELSSCFRKVKTDQNIFSPIFGLYFKKSQLYCTVVVVGIQ